jgi:short subunit dehydrogenase-like uncharacterized protein
MTRPHPLVLFGATGFTGQLVAEELGRRAPGAFAVAGRDVRALRELKASLVGIHPDNGRVPILEASVEDPASLARMAASARVLLTTVGPYLRYGTPVLEACVAAGTHYLDLTGEPPFVGESRRRFGQAAREARIRVVHCCGFDSVPADLGAWFTVGLLPPGPKQVRGYVKTNAGASGGTWASFLEILARGEWAVSPEERGALRPLVHPAPPEAKGQAFPLPAIDRSIVVESARQRPDRYGPDFEYGHFLLLRNRRRALTLGASVAGAAALARFGPTRRWLAARRPSHSGPSEEQRARSFFQVTFVGKGGGQRVVTRVSGGDPGYTETSRMLAAAGLLLAAREAELPVAHGVLTPAVAFGDPLITELRSLGIAFDVLS